MMEAWALIYKDDIDKKDFLEKNYDPEIPIVIYLTRKTDMIYYFPKKHERIDIINHPERYRFEGVCIPAYCVDDYEEYTVKNEFVGLRIEPMYSGDGKGSELHYHIDDFEEVGIFEDYMRG